MFDDYDPMNLEHQIHNVIYEPSAYGSQALLYSCPKTAAVKMRWEKIKPYLRAALKTNEVPELPYSIMAKTLDAMKAYVFYGKEYKLSFLPEDKNQYTPYQKIIRDRLKPDWETFEIYLEYSEFKAPELIEKQLKAIHGIIGLYTEAYEALEHIEGILGNNEDSRDDLFLELGDASWFIEEATSGISATQGRREIANLKKLNTRYKAKAFKSENAINRNYEEENEAVKNMTQPTQTDEKE